MYGRGGLCRSRLHYKNKWLKWLETENDASLKILQWRKTYGIIWFDLIHHDNISLMFMKLRSLLEHISFPSWKQWSCPSGRLSTMQLREQRELFGHLGCTGHSVRCGTYASSSSAHKIYRGDGVATLLAHIRKLKVLAKDHRGHAENWIVS